RARSTGAGCARSAMRRGSSPTGATATAGAWRRWRGSIRPARVLDSVRRRPHLLGFPHIQRDAMSLQQKLDALPGVHPRPAETTGFVFNHTMLRVKDITRSLDFYTRVLGYTLVDMREFPDAGFSLYFLAYVDDASTLPGDPEGRREWLARQQGVLELTHNHGTEDDPDFAYHGGNSDPRGFGHICVSVPDVVAACERFEQLGVPFQKRLTDGRMKSLAFIKDPDGYWVEVIQPTPLP